VGRTVVAGLVVAVLVYVAVDALWTSETEQVEAEVERLIELAKRGGPGAAEEILDALAEDYRGAVSRAEAAAYLERYVLPGRLGQLTHGAIDAMWKGEEILVPLLRIDVEGRTVLLTVVFAERDGEWRVVDVSRAWSR
jgi:hypothetical protein